MNISDLYYEFENLMTPKELEEMNFSSYDDGEMEPTPTWFSDKMSHLVPPDDWDEDKVKFLRRKPALGLTKTEIQDLKEHVQDPRRMILPVQKRVFFDSLRHTMLRQLIPCSGCQTVEELVEILEGERASGVPSPIPDWYVFSPVSHGPRKVGYDKCENCACFVTEDVSRPLFRCAACKMPLYCSKECQKIDWVARHKKMCKECKKQREQKQREQTARVGDFISMFAANMGK
jgi:hypothetical protein